MSNKPMLFKVDVEIDDKTGDVFVSDDLTLVYGVEATIEGAFEDYVTALREWREIKEAHGERVPPTVWRILNAGLKDDGSHDYGRL